MLAIVGLGSNLGDRAETIASAVAHLRSDAAIEVEAMSALYESDAVGPPQPAYINAAVRIRTTLDPDALLDRLLDVERAHGRVRRHDTERWGPRTLDLDLLWVDGPPIQSPRLTVPHPRLHDRPFALAPLLDVLPAPSEALFERLSVLGGPPPRIAPK